MEKNYISALTQESRWQVLILTLSIFMIRFTDIIFSGIFIDSDSFANLHTFIDMVNFKVSQCLGLSFHLPNAL